MLCTSATDPHRSRFYLHLLRWRWVLLSSLKLKSTKYDGLGSLVGCITTDIFYKFESYWAYVLKDRNLNSTSPEKQVNRDGLTLSIPHAFPFLVQTSSSLSLHDYTFIYIRLYGY